MKLPDKFTFKVPLSDRPNLIYTSVKSSSDEFLVTWKDGHNKDCETTVLRKIMTDNIQNNDWIIQSIPAERNRENDLNLFSLDDL